MAARRRVVWAPRAQAALDEAVAFVAQDSASGALRVLEQALAAAESLATLGERGRVVPELNQPNTREIGLAAWAWAGRGSMLATELGWRGAGGQRPRRS